MNEERQQVDLSELVDLLVKELGEIPVSWGERIEGLEWTQKEFCPWWKVLDYSSLEEANERITVPVEPEQIRDRRFFISNTPSFDIEFSQGPNKNYLRDPQFEEALLISLKKELCRKGNFADVPAALRFLDTSPLTPEVLNNLAVPRISLQRTMKSSHAFLEIVYQNSFVNVSYEQKTRFGGIKIEDVEDVTKLMRALVFYSGIDDRIFNGRGVADPIVKKQMKQFALNMQAAYALALISGGNGIDVHEPYWGT